VALIVSFPVHLVDLQFHGRRIFDGNLLLRCEHARLLHLLCKLLMSKQIELGSKMICYCAKFKWVG